MAIEFEGAARRISMRMVAVVFTSILVGYVAIGVIRNAALVDVKRGPAGLASGYMIETNDRGERKYTDLEANRLAESRYASSLKLAEMSALQLIGVYLLAIPFCSFGGSLGFCLVFFISWLSESPVRKYLISNFDRIVFWLIKWVATAIGATFGASISLATMA